jgi:translation initiation factor eIF-2B subunit epsilon
VRSRNSKWSRPGAGLKIVPIVTAKETFTPGDAMRDIYTHGIITSDFVLVTGDLVSNIHIGDVVREHKERRKTDKDAIMTMVVKQSGVNHRTRYVQSWTKLPLHSFPPSSKGDSAVFVIDPETSKCLHYEAVTGYPPKKYTSIPREILNEHPEVEIRNDLIDCSIDICSVEVRLT